MSACFSLAFSNTGANIRHGPHQAAHQSTRVIPSAATVSWKLSLVRVVVAIGKFSFHTRRTERRGPSPPFPTHPHRGSRPCSPESWLQNPAVQQPTVGGRRAVGGEGARWV